jgi:hypothetical protein
MAKKKLAFNPLTGKFDLITKSLVSNEITDFTEAAQDATGAAINAGTQDGVSVSYNDAANKIDFTNTDKGSSAVTSHVAASDPHTQYLKESDNLLINPEVVRVKISNAGVGEFTDIKLALASITDSDPITKPYVLSLGAGNHLGDNSLGPLIVPTGVSIRGEGINVTSVYPANPNQHLFQLNTLSEIAFLNLKGITGSIGSGKAAIYCEDVGDFAQIHKVSVYDFDIGIENFANAGSSTLYTEYTDINGNFSYAVKNAAVSPQSSRTQLENFYTYASNGTNPVHIFSSGPNAELIMNSTGLFGTTDNVGILIEDGCNASISDTFVREFTGSLAVGLIIANVGSGPVIESSGISFSGNFKDMSIENPATTGSISVIADKTKITVDPASSVVVFLNNSTMGGISFTGELNYDSLEFNKVKDIGPLITTSSTMGIYEGGGLSSGGGLVVNVAAFKGYVSSTTPTLNDVKYLISGAQTITVPDNSDIFIYINNSGILNYSANTPDTINEIHLGRVVTESGIILYIEESSFNSHHYSNQADRFFREAIGPVYNFGSSVAENGTRQLDVSSGEYYFSQKEYVLIGGTAISWDSFYKSATPGIYTRVSGDTVVSNALYDNGSGTLASIPTGKYAKHSLYVLADGTEKYLLIYAQSVWDTLAEASVAPLPTPPSFVRGAFARVASFIVQEGVTNIVQILDERPRIGFSSTSVSGGITDHASLSGLSNPAAHPQYLLRDGSNVMTGTLDLNTNPIINASLVNGVNVQAHAARHAFNGADPFLSTTPQSVGTANVEGVDNTHFSRGDHVHAHGNLGGGSTHAAATTTVNGYMSAADKVKLDAISTTVSAVTASAPLSSSGGLTPNISISQASTSVDGYLSASDFTTFNNKQPAGNYITALTGDVTATGPNSVAATIAANAVTLAKMAQLPANTLIGNNTGATATPLALTKAQVLSFLGISGTREIKSGNRTSGTFTGTPRTSTVTFSTPMSSTSYSIAITGADARTWSYQSKTINGFVINANSGTALTGEVSWTAISNGETNE